MSASRTYSEQQVRDRIERELPAWRFEEGQLVRRFAGNGWRSNVLLANGIAHLAELTWHHPELTIRWDGIEVRLHTHSEQGITARDFELAAMIERSLGWRPAPESALEGAPAEGQWRYLADD
jgi:pterin-4a-carbinolamine dehydratase